jgi:hypothetical protein
MVNQNTRSRIGEVFYWIVTRYGDDKKLVIIGPKQTEEEAQQFAYQKLEGLSFEIVPLETRDRGRATSEIKAKILGSTGNLGNALQKARHQPPNIRPASAQTPIPVPGMQPKVTYDSQGNNDGW